MKTATGQGMKRWYWFSIAALVTILSGCLEDDNPIMKGREPEIVSKDFFEAIYNERDLEAAQAVSTEGLADLLGSYGTVNGVQRHLLNRYYDEVEIVIDTTTMGAFMGQPDSMRINVLMTGTYDGDMIDELRSIIIVRVNERWYVDSILDDPYKSYGK